MIELLCTLVQTTSPHNKPNEFVFHTGQMNWIISPLKYTSSLAWSGVSALSHLFSASVQDESNQSTGEYVDPDVHLSEEQVS